MSVSAFTKNVSLSFANMYCTVEGRLAFLQEAKRRELRKRHHLACAIAEEGRRRAITEEERRYAKRPRSEARVPMKKAPAEGKTYTTEYAKEEETEYAKAHAKMEKELAKMEKELAEEETTYAIECAKEYTKAHAKMEKKLANVKKAEEALAKERAKESAKEKEKERANMSMRKKRAEDNRILSLSDDDMMTAVLQSLGHPNTIGADLLSVYTLWLFTATKYHKNGRLMNRLALMNAFAVEYFSLARRGDNPYPYGGTARPHTPFS